MIIAKKPKYCFVFVCQAGELEIKSMLLAASLRIQNGRDVELVAAVPESKNKHKSLDQNTLILINELDIRTEKIKNQINEDYPIGNKVACLGIQSSAEKIIFLDSDILCLNKVPEDAFPGLVNVKPADLHTAARDPKDWEYIYSLFSLPLPKRKISTSVTSETILPYFNAGVVAIENGIDLYPIWEDCCRKIDRDPAIENKRPHLDQLALPVAITRLGIDFQCMGEDMNFPAHLKLLPGKLPVLCHYHWPSIIRREPVLSSYVLNLVERYNALGNLIKNISPIWEKLLTPPKLLEPDASSKKWKISLGKKPHFHNHIKIKLNYPELIITGIPRSGTSLLCRLLHELPDTVIINEPKEIFGPLTSGQPPSWIATFYRELRMKILDGSEIENKIKNGRVIEDTREVDKRELYHPQVSRPNFVLGTKNTLAYMARLSLLRFAMPAAPIVACIRNPIDTIASWKTSFPHLENITLQDFPVNYANNSFLTWQEKHRLEEIMNCREVPIRRALLWRHLTEVIKEHRDRLCVIRYEDLVQDPISQIDRIETALGNPAWPKHRQKILSPRSKREILDIMDYQAISDLCHENARYFGYKV